MQTNSSVIVRWLIVVGVAVVISPIRADELSFTDITIEAGTSGPTGAKTGGHGAMFADIDSDGRPDLYITMIFREPMADLLFRNLGSGTFADEGRKRGVADFDGGSHGACFADLDNDGDYDLFNGTTWDNPDAPAWNNIFRNDGSGSFTDVTDVSGIPGDRRWPTRGVLTFDMDSDGDLDLFGVTNYQGTRDPAGERNEVYRNDSGLQFTPINHGPLFTAPCGQGAIDTDFDGDGDIDVIAANRTGPLNVLRNNGGQFVLVEPQSIGIRHRAGDGITTADVDNDGDLDLLLAGDDVGHLYTNGGGGQFSFMRSFEGIDGYMGGIADLDNDGDLDFVFAGDDVCWLNDGHGEFSKGPAIPVSGIDDPRGIAFADIDNDGDLDFAVGCKRSRNWLVRNNCDAGNWLRIKLLSPQGQAGAFGAKTRVFSVAGMQLGLRESRSNNGYLGQDDPTLHFGLGKHSAVDVVVNFLDGTTAELRNVAANQIITVDGRRAKKNSDSPARPASQTSKSLDRVGTQWAPYLEWELENATRDGNPFDLDASATFVHEESGERRTTGMFYNGDDTWKFRFTGTRTGVWRFETSSPDPDLSNRHGTITINPNPNPRSPGFVINIGNKWARSGTGEVFVPQLVMYAGPTHFYNRPNKIDEDIKTFFVDHGFNGFHVVGCCHWLDLDQRRSDRVGDTNPDPRTFQAFELLINKANAAGGMVHIWMWGDEARRWTPTRWGLNGEVDRRLQRYLASRLGPLPGWTMGYGFDLFEWVQEDDLRKWHAHMHKQFGWPHLLGGRAYHDSFRQIYEGLDYSSYQQHRPDYAKYLESFEKRPDKPSFSEDRFRIRDVAQYVGKDYDIAMTRRGLWRSAMAGGVANIWGHLPRGRDSWLGSAPYDRREWIKTYSVFFQRRFRQDLTVSGGITNGACLKNSSHTRYLIYKEDADSIQMDLSAMKGSPKAVAVDALKSYVEIDLGLLQSKRQTWRAPYKSDWAIAIGDVTR